MPPYRPRTFKGRSEAVTRLSVSEKILEWLTILQNTFPPKELDQGEIERWVQDLGQYPISAIEFACESWRKNGRIFPLPAHLIELCKAWNPPGFDQRPCSPACKSGHDRGYSWNAGDLPWLWAKMAEIPGKPTASQWNALLDELDSKRVGGAPSAAGEWRR